MTSDEGSENRRLSSMTINEGSENHMEEETVVKRETVARKTMAVDRKLKNKRSDPGVSLQVLFIRLFPS